jgi:hypothetical protein
LGPASVQSNLSIIDPPSMQWVEGEKSFKRVAREEGIRSPRYLLEISVFMQSTLFSRPARQVDAKHDSFSQNRVSAGTQFQATLIPSRMSPGRALKVTGFFMCYLHGSFLNPYRSPKFPARLYISIFYLERWRYNTTFTAKKE